MRSGSRALGRGRVGMTEAANGSVLVAHRSAPMRRILRLNLEAEQIDTVEAASAWECVQYLRARRPGAVVLDPDILHEQDDAAVIPGLLRDLGMPLLVLSAEPEHRRTAQLLGGAPFCNRPDDVERVTAAVRELLSGVGLPSLV
jgi:DNA-binding response OmpR family regulator